MDGCPPAGIPEFSFAKAYTCISMSLSSRAFRDKYTADAADPGKYCQMLSMVNITGGKMAPFPVSVSVIGGAATVVIVMVVYSSCKAFRLADSAMPFGTISAVHAWHRVGAAIQAILAEVFDLAYTRYVDDFGTSTNV